MPSYNCFVFHPGKASKRDCLEGNGTSNQQDSCHCRDSEGHFFARCSSLPPYMFFKFFANDGLAYVSGRR